MNVTELKAKYFALLGRVLCITDRKIGKIKLESKKMTKAWEGGMGRFSQNRDLG